MHVSKSDALVKHLFAKAVQGIYFDLIVLEFGDISFQFINKIVDQRENQRWTIFGCVLQEKPEHE